MAKALRAILCIALVVTMISAVAMAGAAYLLNVPAEQKQEDREIIVDYGVPGSPTATHVYINPYVVGPGQYVYVYANEDSRVIGYREDHLKWNGN